MKPSDENGESTDDSTFNRRTVLKGAAAGMVASPFAIGSAAAHRPDAIDWYEHWIIDYDCTDVFIEDELPGGNVFKVGKDKALNHIAEDHGWSETEMADFEEELDKLCLGLEPNWDIINWYTHEIIGCAEESDGSRTIVVEDGLGYTFTITEEFLMDHLKHDHGWSFEERSEFKDDLDHYCEHQTA